MATYTSATEHLPANQLDEAQDFWLGTEVRWAPECTHSDPAGAPCVPTGGSYVIDGPGAAEVEFVEELVATETEWTYGDPGYHVRFRRPVGALPVDITTTVEYTA